MALGAGRQNVLRMSLSRGAWLAAGGLTVGILGSVGIARWIASLLFEVRARDPWTIASAAVVVAAVTLIASYLPAQRAARVDPLIALRSE
jgi:ABC-type antimicrobial peptide transport system permease subunit